jgi:hypothetical protein
MWLCFHPRALTNLPLFLPEDASILVLGLETLVRRYSPVEQALAVVEAAQALHQPVVSCNRNT